MELKRSEIFPINPNVFNYWNLATDNLLTGLKGSEDDFIRIIVNGTDVWETVVIKNELLSKRKANNPYLKDKLNDVFYSYTIALSSILGSTDDEKHLIMLYLFDALTLDKKFNFDISTQFINTTFQNILKTEKNSVKLTKFAYLIQLQLLNNIRYSIPTSVETISKEFYNNINTYLEFIFAIVTKLRSTVFGSKNIFGSDDIEVMDEAMDDDNDNDNDNVKKTKVKIPYIDIRQLSVNYPSFKSKLIKILESFSDTLNIDALVTQTIVQNDINIPLLQPPPPPPSPSSLQVPPPPPPPPLQVPDEPKNWTLADIFNVNFLKMQPMIYIASLLAYMGINPLALKDPNILKEELLRVFNKYSSLTETQKNVFWKLFTWSGVGIGLFFATAKAKEEFNKWYNNKLAYLQKHNKKRYDLVMRLITEFKDSTKGFKERGKKLKQIIKILSDEPIFIKASRSANKNPRHHHINIKPKPKLKPKPIAEIQRL